MSFDEIKMLWLLFIKQNKLFSVSADEIGKITAEKIKMSGEERRTHVQKYEVFKR